MVGIGEKAVSIQQISRPIEHGTGGHDHGFDAISGRVVFVTENEGVGAV